MLPTTRAGGLGRVGLGIGRLGKGEPEWLATLFGNEWTPTIMRERIVLLLQVKDAVFLEI